MFIGLVLCEIGCPETRQGEQISGLITYRVTGGGEVSPAGNAIRRASRQTDQGAKLDAKFL